MKQYLMPFYEDTIIEPGGHCEFVNSPQLPCIPIRLIVSLETAESFVITDILYGGCSQFINAGLLWLHPFVAQVPGCDKQMASFVSLSEDVNVPASYIPFFELDVAVPYVDIRTCVTNLSSKPHRFEGYYVVRYVELPAKNPHGRPNWLRDTLRGEL